MNMNQFVLIGHLGGLVYYDESVNKWNITIDIVNEDKEQIENFLVQIWDSMKDNIDRFNAGTVCAVKGHIEKTGTRIDLVAEKVSFMTEAEN